MRNLDMSGFIKTMKESKTSGLDLTLLILCEMLNISIVVLFQSYFWKSTDLDLNNFHVYLIMFTQDRFISVTPRSCDHINLKLHECGKEILHREQLCDMLRKLMKSAERSGEPSGSSFKFDPFNDIDTGHAVDGMTEEIGLLAAGKCRMLCVMRNGDKDI